MQKRTTLIFLLLLAPFVVMGVWLVAQPSSSGPPAARKRVPKAQQPRELARQLKLPPIRPSRFLNATSAAEYVGSARCAECHPDEHDSYLRTPHSRALGEVDLAQEPDEVEIDHALSGRIYTSYHQDDQMRHRESVRGPDGETLVLADHPVRYTIGSGNHSRSYLIESGDFLVESPLTWYTSKQDWGMSPGFDRRYHPGFERLAEVGCLYCHAGRIEPINQSRFRARIHEASIGCESCHGPGSLHVAHRQSGEESEATGEADLTIVHPRELDRETSEAICAQCHLRGDATVMLRERQMTDYRPGLQLSDFRTEYVLERSDKSMTVVGHVEQMRLSRCYQESEMTCTTCHDPHGRPMELDRVAYFRQKCIGCHEASSCGLPHEERVKVHADDYCVVCHMPQSPTDIPHFAFTHHRVGLHEPPAPETLETEVIGQLVPVHDNSHLPEIEQRRSLGLAYLEYSDKQKGSKSFATYRLRAVRLLESVRDDGLNDGDVTAALARIRWEDQDLSKAIQLASDTLRHGGSSGATANALFVLGDSFLQQDEPERALMAIGLLADKRRESEDWLLVAMCHERLDRLDEAVLALERAAEISPTRLFVQEMLAELYQRTGREEKAAESRQRVAALRLLYEDEQEPETGDDTAPARSIETPP